MVRVDERADGLVAAVAAMAQKRRRKKGDSPALGLLEEAVQLEHFIVAAFDGADSFGRAVKVLLQTHGCVRCGVDRGEETRWAAR